MEKIRDSCKICTLLEEDSNGTYRCAKYKFSIKEKELHDKVCLSLGYINNFERKESIVLLFIRGGVFWDYQLCTSEKEVSNLLELLCVQPDRDINSDEIIYIKGTKVKCITNLEKWIQK